MSIITGDCLHVMKEMDDNSISAIVTDPPYGLKFMGKDWDHGIPGVPFWKESLRISKPGTFLLAFGGTRTYHRLACAIEDAGWEIRDCLQWIYGSGFPKSHNHFGIEGYGTALKPAHEPIIMAMKPCDGTFAENAEKWGQAGINIDECRIGNSGASRRSCQSPYPKKEDGTEHRETHWARTGHAIVELNKGRWPANVLFDEEGAKVLDEQSGISKSRPDYRTTETYNSIYQGGFKRSPNFVNDSGGASRFFYCAKASPSERNRGLDHLEDKLGGGFNATLKGDTRTGHITIQKNNHPTVKPLKLMKYLITLVMPPKDGILLDPFCGSGSTIVAANELGFDAIGIEKCEEYAEIARARLENCEVETFTTDQYDLFEEEEGADVSCV